VRGSVFGEPRRGIDDWDKPVLFVVCATARRSTSSLADMSLGLSKFVIAIEVLLLLVPTSALAFWDWAFSLLSAANHPLDWWALFVLFPTICLMCGWILVFRFFAYGHTALVSTSSWIWFGAILGALAAISALAINLGAASVREVLPEGFGLLVVGAPALVPLTHLVLERVFRKSANNRFERSRVASSVDQGGSR